MEERSLLIGARCPPQQSPVLEPNTEKPGFDWSRCFLDMVDFIGSIFFAESSSIKLDAASMGVRHFIVIWSLAMVFWLLSVNLIVTALVSFDKFTINDWPLFLPMWIGSSMGLCGSISVFWRLYSGATLITRERRQYMLAQGILDNQLLIEYENLPLMRVVLLWSFGGALTFAVMLTSQWLYFLWFNNQLSSLLEVFVPIGSLFTLLGGYMLFSRIFTVSDAISLTLLVLQAILFSLKIRDHHKEIPWLLAAVPLLLLCFFTVIQLFTVWKSHFVDKHIALQSNQLLAVHVHLSSLCLLIVATLYASSCNMDAPDWSPNMVYFIWMFVCNASCLAILYVWRFEGSKLADIHQQFNPLLPYRSSEEQSTHYRRWSWLLGEIRPIIDHITLVNGHTTTHSAHGASTQYGSNIELSPVHPL